MDLCLSDWLATIEGAYLRDFVAHGGAAVKFAIVPPSLSGAEVRREIERVARDAGCAFAAVDAATTKVHLIDQLFFAVARQLDWDDLAARRLRRLLAEGGFSVPDLRSRLDYRTVAELNDYDEGELRRDVRLLLTSRVFRDFAMAHEFRIAMVRLCQAQLEPDGSARPEADAVKEWLRGELRSISLLRDALIFQRVARHNARDMVLSLAHWLRQTGDQGMVLTLDLERYLVDRRPFEGDGSLYHTATAAMDAYEVLRQFIDATDELEACLIVAIAPAVFLDDQKRGLERYDPLKLRIWDEVRDRRIANPLSSLVRLRPDTGGMGRASAVEDGHV